MTTVASESFPEATHSSAVLSDAIDSLREEAAIVSMVATQTFRRVLEDRAPLPLDIAAIEEIMDVSLRGLCGCAAAVDEAWSRRAAKISLDAALEQGRRGAARARYSAWLRGSVRACVVVAATASVAGIVSQCALGRFGRPRADSGGNQG